ncbi:hypothetical protein AALP_AAs61703U000100 [Arabis alpina]|uniref:CCHC-type domain-containing protein n=1 Tax=Arabis alpina TaxID=50452 RepID=A0A087G2Z2_ARAAL|nr:hypothetical protein AALP_AAs61703U000100 [Arabis alpina]
MGKHHGPKPTPHPHPPPKPPIPKPQTKSSVETSVPTTTPKEISPSTERPSTPTRPSTSDSQDLELGEIPPLSPSAPVAPTLVEPGSQIQLPEMLSSAMADEDSTTTPPIPAWSDLFKGPSGKMKKKGTPFLLDSGEICVKIPNEVIQRNHKRWDSFVLGQFHGNLPSPGALHAIFNGIWSRKLRDITISKLGSNTVLIRIPCPSTRIPVWLEFRGVPPHFFSEEGLEHVAGALGHPLHLHPSTANMTNLEVAKVFTIINPSKPLPEAMNVQFESVEIRRIEVACPWLPPICDYCKAVGHSQRRCPTTPITCSACKSTAHADENCPRAKKKDDKVEAHLASVEIKTQSQKKNPKRRKKEKQRQLLLESKALSIQEPEESLPKASKTLKAGKRDSKKRLTADEKGKGHASLDSPADKYLIKEKTRSPTNLVVSSSEESSSEEDSIDAEQVEDSSSDSDTNSHSGEEDNPVDDARFMKVVSRKLQKKKPGSSGKHPKSTPNHP